MINTISHELWEISCCYDHLLLVLLLFSRCPLHLPLSCHHSHSFRSDGVISSVIFIHSVLSSYRSSFVTLLRLICVRWIAHNHRRKKKIQGDTGNRYWRWQDWNFYFFCVEINEICMPFKFTYKVKRSAVASFLQTNSRANSIPQHTHTHRKAIRNKKASLR